MIAEKGERLRQQLGYAPDTPLHEVVSKAEHDLGLTAEHGQNLVQRMDACCSAVGIGGAQGSSAKAAVPGVVTGIVMVQPVSAQPVASVAPVQDMMSVAEEMVEPHVPRVDGTYHGPMRLRYVLAATADPRVISARIFQGGRAITGNFEMRNTGALAAWRQPVWEGALPRHVHGGAMLRLEFDQGFGAFFSTARGKPRRRFVKQSVVAPVAPVPAADGLRRPHDEMSAQDLEGCWLYAGVWLFPPLPIVAFSRHEARSPTHYMTSGWSPCLPVIPMFAHYLKRGDHWEGYMDPGGGSGEPGDGAPLCGAKRVMRNRNLIYATPGSFWGFVRRLC